MLVELIRHGETAYNREARYQGQSDIPLSPQGRAVLKPAPFCPEIVYTSPLARARETAQILFPGAHLVPVLGLIEMDFGAFEGKNYKEMEHDPAYRAWVEGGCLSRCSGGESKEEFCRRVCAAFSQLMEEPTERLTVVAHGGTLMAILERWGLPQRGYFDWHVPPGCGFLLEGGGPGLRVLWQTDYRKEPPL